MTLLYYCITLCFFFSSQEEEEHAGVDSDLDDSGSEVDEEPIEEQVNELQNELGGEVMEKECPQCKGNVTPPLVSGNKGNQQPTACSSEEVLYMSHFTDSQTSTMKPSKQTRLEASLGVNYTQSGSVSL